MEAIVIEAVEAIEIESNDSAVLELSLAQLSLVGGGEYFVEMA